MLEDYKINNFVFSICILELAQLECLLTRVSDLSEIKERIKKTKDEKKAKKAELVSKQKIKSNVPKGAAPKGPKIGGGGGKR